MSKDIKNVLAILGICLALGGCNALIAELTRRQTAAAAELLTPDSLRMQEQCEESLLRRTPSTLKPQLLRRYKHLVGRLGTETWVYEFYVFRRSAGGEVTHATWRCEYGEDRVNWVRRY